ncbi:restriction endonuclease subunit S [Hahella sp. CR1]|uniref:restriction endonuclease subunit S n=1 Tax=Hahella sp. CR1 TaxID=2992807 RepID=UPI0024422E9E|nr:restriction endonuclease subunit S [Hahella sp. CR1]MDG9672168.1 restriction endonuclease subunit S [Hahella sp. CR1]
MKTLGEIARLRSGQVFSSGLIDDPEGTYFVANSKAIENYSLEKSKLVRQPWNKVQESKLVHPNDILFCAKSTQNRALVFDLVDENVVASSFFHILTVKREYVLPRYLAWFINHPDTQKRLSDFARGATVKFISLTSLKDFSIAVPSLDIQEKIIVAADLAEKEQKILNNILIKKRSYIDAKLLSAALNGVIS